MRTLDAQPAEDASLPPNESRMIYLAVSFDSEEDVPEALDNRIEAMAAAGPGATEPSSVQYGVGALELAGRTPPFSLHRWRARVGWPSTAAAGPMVSIEVQCWKSMVASTTRSVSPSTGCVSTRMDRLL